MIVHFFPQLSIQQKEHFKALGPLYEQWNNNLNLISRKDIAHLYLRHVLHGLSIAKVISFVPGTQIVDVGTGGGFPGIPLAIMFPQAHFHLIDAIGKKIKAVDSMVQTLALHNVTTSQIRAENLNQRYDFVVARAVTALPTFFGWAKNLLKTEQHNKLPNGIFYLKGGDFADELAAIPAQHSIYPIHNFFDEPFFETKKLVYLRVASHATSVL